MSFQAIVPVRFQDVDAGGVLFFGHIFDYCHQAYEEFIGSSGVDRAKYFAGGDFLVPIAHAGADYRKPIRYGERVTVAIDVTRVGRASFRLRYQVTGPAGDLRVEAVTIHAFVEYATMKPIPIPEPLRSFFLRHQLAEPVENRAAQ